MDMFEQFLFDIKIDFTERKINTQVFDLDCYDVVLIFIGRDFLDMFEPRDGIIAAGEFLSPYWGEYLYSNLDCFPYWVAHVRHKTVERNRLIECLDQMNKVMDYHKKRVRN